MAILIFIYLISVLFVSLFIFNMMKQIDIKVNVHNFPIIGFITAIFFLVFLFMIKMPFYYFLIGLVTGSLLLILVKSVENNEDKSPIINKIPLFISCIFCWIHIIILILFIIKNYSKIEKL